MNTAKTFVSEKEAEPPIYGLVHRILATLNGRLTQTEFAKAFPLIWENIFESFNFFVNESLVVSA